MGKVYRIILIIGVFFTLVSATQRFYKRHLIQEEYWKALEQKEDEQINIFYQSSFSGVVTYIKHYENNPDNYVSGITDSAKTAKRIGKVEITNFSDVMEGDSVRKKMNSFELEIIGRKEGKISLVKHE